MILFSFWRFNTDGLDMVTVLIIAAVCISLTYGIDFLYKKFKNRKRS